jgi:hypothetical protein
MMLCLLPLQDVVVGKIYFLLVRIKLKHMEVEIRRRETTGEGQGLGEPGKPPCVIDSLHF